MARTSFTDMEIMLSPETLSDLVGRPITSVHLHPFEAIYAKSGSRLFFVETNHGEGPRFILKQISLEWDWLMRATQDHGCRSVKLWEAGLLDRMPPELAHGVLACARDGEGWGILLEDYGEYLIPYEPFSLEDNDFFLDVMASLHASFWDHAELELPELGLCTIRNYYTMFAPQTGHREAGGLDEVPRRILEGWELVEKMVEPDVFDLVQSLLDDSYPLTRALRRYPRTLIHGDLRHANMGLLRKERPRLVLLDWQLASFSSPSVDLGRYLGTNSALLPLSKESILGLYKQKLAARLGERFDEDWWQPQLELGMLGGFVQEAWAIALKASHWHIGEGHRERWKADLQWWSEKARVGAKWL